MPKVVLSQSVQDLVGACEYLFILNKGIGLSQDERDIVEYYLRELPSLLTGPKNLI